MIISEKALPQINLANSIALQYPAPFHLPEKILQFGTGVLLRGLPDYFVDKANKQEIFNGRIVVVKSTNHGDTNSFKKQDCLYTLCVRGIVGGRKEEQYILNNSISRVLNAHSEWQQILACAEKESMQIIISNTTEAGIKLAEDNIFANPPVSFPGKLLAFLFARYEFFNGSVEKGMVIIPTELLVNNGDKLKQVLIALAEQNKLKKPFIDWVTDHNIFCNSLVDRIVPGKPSDEEKAIIERKLGYEDDLMVTTEPYRLWAIEVHDKRAGDIVSFSKADKGVVICEDISKYRELKLRLLNGTHTFSCGLACLTGIETVKDAMEDDFMFEFIHGLMIKEIVPSIVSDKISEEEARQFTREISDRFNNPFMKHLWYSITTEYTSKMKMRNVPIILSHYKRSNQPPKLMSKGFASYISFMRSEKGDDGKFHKKILGKDYEIRDSLAGVIYAYWQKNPDDPSHSILSDQSLWGTDLSILPGFEKEISKNLTEVFR